MAKVNIEKLKAEFYKEVDRRGKILNDLNAELAKEENNIEILEEEREKALISDSPVARDEYEKIEEKLSRSKRAYNYLSEKIKAVGKISVLENNRVKEIGGEAYAYCGYQYNGMIRDYIETNTALVERIKAAMALINDTTSFVNEINRENHSNQSFNYPDRVQMVVLLNRTENDINRLKNFLNNFPEG